jgi:hypothetical protein
MSDMKIVATFADQVSFPESICKPLECVEINHSLASIERTIKRLNFASGTRLLMGWLRLPGK